MLWRISAHAYFSNAKWCVRLIYSCGLRGIQRVHFFPWPWNISKGDRPYAGRCILRGPICRPTNCNHGVMCVRRRIKPATGRRLRFCVIAATVIRKHTQVESLWITRRIRRISAFPSNSERLDASVFTSTLPAIKRNSRTISTRATDVIFERKHCSRRRSHTQVEITSPHKQLGNWRTITRNSWHGARIS